MDSANSGSLQSSSGGDEEYDSRAAAAADSISAFINNHHHHQPLSNPPQQPTFHHHPPPIFDPLSNYFNPSTSRPPSNSNPLLNLDPLIWSKTPQHQPDHDQINPYFNPQPVSQSDVVRTTLPTLPLPPVTATADQNQRASSSSATSSTPSVVRNPKKRSRASRRAPTTVLTTDTTNFRAMVQEFTGIPAPPFTNSSSPFPRSRLDLFGTPSSIRSNPNTFDNTPPYLLRPFPQKPQPPPFLNSSSPLPSMLNTTSSTNNMHNSINNASFQSNFLNQTLPNSSFLAGLKTNANSLEIPSSSNTLVDDHQFGEPNSNSYTNGKTTAAAGYSTNDTTTASFQVGKTSETRMNGSAGRGEGMVESWICSTSD